MYILVCTVYTYVYIFVFYSDTKSKKNIWTKSTVDTLPPIEIHQKVSYLLVTFKYQNYQGVY